MLRDKTLGDFDDDRRVPALAGPDDRTAYVVVEYWNQEYYSVPEKRPVAVFMTLTGAKEFVRKIYNRPNGPRRVKTYTFGNVRCSYEIVEVPVEPKDLSKLS